MVSRPFSSVDSINALLTLPRVAKTLDKRVLQPSNISVCNGIVAIKMKSMYITKIVLAQLPKMWAVPNGYTTLLSVVL